MLYYLFDNLADSISGFNVFRYLTFRVILSALTALVVALLIGPWMIRMLDRLQVGQQIRDSGPESHQAKAGTPTMGGALILAAVCSSTLLWSDLGNRYVWVVFLVTLSFGLVGLVDDYLKVRNRRSKGLSGIAKLAGQSLVGIVLALYLYKTATSPDQLLYIIPFTKSTVVDLGLFFMVATYLVVVGTSNAVNLTDGLDGLAILPTVMVGGALGLFSYLAGHQVFAGYLDIPYVQGVGEVAIFCGSIVGAGLGFLWFNTYPAQVFMGDVGALALGAALGVVAVLARQELVLAIMGGVFVMEALSVIVQVASFQLTGKRVFQMAPIHHHFELKGWPEPRVIVRFWIITFVLVLIGLASLKIR